MLSREVTDGPTKFDGEAANVSTQCYPAFQKPQSHLVVKKDVASTRTPSAQYRRDVGEFLRTKRAALKPSDLGLPTISQRRVAGLRREEVAAAAAMGVTWYTWLEQGRDIQVSSEMLQRIARALLLSPTETTYLFDLAGKPAPEIREATPRLQATIKSLLDGYTAGPAFVMDELFNIKEFNALADLIYRFEGYDGPRRRNMFWRDFIDPFRRQLYVPWLENVTNAVGLLRSAYARRKGEPKIEELVKDLCDASAEFTRLWDASRQRGPSSYAPAEVHLHVPNFGDLKFISVTLIIVTYPDWLLVLMSPTNEWTVTAMNLITLPKKDS